MIGWFGADVVDFVSDKVEDVVDAAGDAVKALPGGSELLEAAQDFAKTPTGLVVMRAFSGALYGSIAWAVGPQLASVTFAVPGLFRGEKFEDAWLVEFKWRVEKTAETLGPGIVDIFGKQLQDTLLKMAGEFSGSLVDMTARELSKRFNVREDVAAFALSLWNRVQPPAREEFDPATGRRRVQSLGKRDTGLPDVEHTPCESYRYYTSQPSYDQVPAIAEALRRKCEYAYPLGGRTTSVVELMAKSGLIPYEDDAPVDVAIAVEEEPAPSSNVGNFALAAVVLAAAGLGYAYYRKLL